MNIIFFVAFFKCYYFSAFMLHLTVSQYFYIVHVIACQGDSNYDNRLTLKKCMVIGLRIYVIFAKILLVLGFEAEICV